MFLMFQGSGKNSASYNLNLANWDVSRVTNMQWMFNTAGQLSSSLAINIKGFNLTNGNTVLQKTNYLFTAMPSFSQITVGSTEVRDWILSQSDSIRPASWTTENFIIDAE